MKVGLKMNLTKKQLVDIIYEYRNKEVTKKSLNSNPKEALEFYFDEYIRPELDADNLREIGA